jgi:transcriptional regulator with XRE-family HTH domain
MKGGTICSFDDIGWMLKKLRLQQSVTQTTLSIEAKCSASAVSGIEKRSEKVMCLEHIENLFSALGYDIKFIVVPREVE